MRGWKTTLAVLAAVLAAGCTGDGEEEETTTFAQTLRGTWVSCTNEGGPTDVREVVVFDGTGFVVREYVHPTSDLSCGGAGALQDGEAMSGGTAVGASVVVPDPEGGASVTAYELDATGVESRYTIAYVKTSVTPNVLYMGDDSGANDGSTRALRPRTLQAYKPRARAAAPPAFPASLQGSFASCSNDGMPEGTTDYREVLTFDGSSVEVRFYDYSTTDGTCGGNGSLRLDDGFEASVTLGADVAATLGVMEVTATAADVDPVLDGATFHSIVWVDSLASPRTLYTGDDEGLDPTDPAQRPDTLQLHKPRHLLPEPPAFPMILQGSWEACTYEADAGNDVREVFQFAATTMSYLAYDHTTTDGTCGGGAGTLSASVGGAYTIGAAVATSLGTLGVTAHALDLPFPLYTIVHVDAFATPYALYIGDDRDPDADGSSAAERHAALQDYKPRFRVP